MVPSPSTWNPRPSTLDKKIDSVGEDSDEDDISVMTVNEVVNAIETSEKWRTNLLILTRDRLAEFGLRCSAGNTRYGGFWL